MEGDAGAGRRLNPPPMSMLRRLRNRRVKNRQESDAAADQISPEAEAEDVSASEVGTDQIGPEVTAEECRHLRSEPTRSARGEAEDASASEVGTDQIGRGGGRGCVGI